MTVVLACSDQRQSHVPCSDQHQSHLPCCSYDLGSKHCFKHFVTPKSFDAARRTCLRWKGHLATLTSPEENSFAVSAVNWASGSMEDVWVGYSDAQGSQMEFEWLTGEVAGPDTAPNANKIILALGSPMKFTCDPQNEAHGPLRVHARPWWRCAVPDAYTSDLSLECCTCVWKDALSLVYQMKILGHIFECDSM